MPSMAEPVRTWVYGRAVHGVERRIQSSPSLPSVSPTQPRTDEQQPRVLGDRSDDLARPQSHVGQGHEGLAPEAVAERAGPVHKQEGHGLVHGGDVAVERRGLRANLGIALVDEHVDDLCRRTQVGMCQRFGGSIRLN